MLLLNWFGTLILTRSTHPASCCWSSCLSPEIGNVTLTLWGNKRIYIIIALSLNSVCGDESFLVFQ